MLFSPAYVHPSYKKHILSLTYLAIWFYVALRYWSPRCLTSLKYKETNFKFVCAAQNNNMSFQKHVQVTLDNPQTHCQRVSWGLFLQKLVSSSTWTLLTVVCGLSKVTRTLFLERHFSMQWAPQTKLNLLPLFWSGGRNLKTKCIYRLDATRDKEEIMFFF